MKQPLVVTLALGLVITGCINSIATKYQDNQCVAHCNNPAKAKHFEQPVLQTLQMFIGESSSFLFLAVLNLCSRYGSVSPSPSVSDRPKLPSSKTHLLVTPAVCDILGTTLMNVGLLLVPVSIYQMMRGAVVIFVALFSVAFLKHKISRIEWLALSIVVFGVAVVGLSGGSGSAEISSGFFAGVLLILCGQVFTATQFVVEEHILSQWSMAPLKLVGYEGVFGAGVTTLAMVAMHLLVGKGKHNSPFNMTQAFGEMTSNATVMYSSIVIMFSIALFNFFGISITSYLNATSRSTLDTCRTMLVWFVSLCLGWETFKLAQLFGFCCLVFGTLVFNGAIVIDQYLPMWFRVKPELGYEPIIDSIDEQIERQ